MVILHVYLKVVPEQRDVFFETVKPLVAGTLAEEGCLGYHLYEDTVQPNAFILVEKWKDAESLELHGQTAHIQAYRNAVQELGLLAEPGRVERYEV